MTDTPTLKVYTSLEQLEKDPPEFPIICVSEGKQGRTCVSMEDARHFFVNEQFNNT